MIILHIANVDKRKSSGPNINVPQNVIYGNKYENVALYNLSTDDPPIGIDNEHYFSIRDYESYIKLPSPFNEPDLVVFQNMYIFKQYKISRKLYKRKIPYIVVPRCSLTKAAQNNKKIKKLIGNCLFFNKFVSCARSIQFLTENEYLESRGNFKFNNYFIVGNGVELPTKKYQLKNRKEFKVVYIGRYNIYHKGLDMLLEVVNDNHKWFIDNSVTINLYGSDSENGTKYLEDYVQNNTLSDVVKVNGPVFDSEKEKIILDSDAFIHTSRLEGQPTSVIEAISYGVPVIVTPGTNIYNEVNENNLGFVCDFNKESIYKCLVNTFKNKNIFNKISKNEVEYSKMNFDWNEVVKKTISYYK